MKTITLVVAFFIVFFVGGCLKQTLGVYQYRELSGHEKTSCEPTADTIHGILGEIWNSNFFQKTQQNRETILGIEYGIFDSDEGSSIAMTEDEYTECKIGRACFVSRDHRDLIMLQRKLFCSLSFESINGKSLTRPTIKTTYRDLDANVKSTVLHEILHAFWAERLTDDQRTEFGVEAEIFFRGLSVSGPYADLIEIHYYYSDDRFFGTELYARIGVLGFQGVEIPKQLAIYYNQ